MKLGIAALTGLRARLSSRAGGTAGGRATFEGSFEGRSVGSSPERSGRRAPRDLCSLADLEALLARRCRGEVLRRAPAEIRGLADHSACVEPGFVFFAVPGTRADGASFAAEALGAGAVAIVAERPLPVPLPCFVVADVRRAASLAAHEFYRRPSAAIPVVGVTGTNGKTTVADLVRLCLEDEYGDVGSLGTIDYRLGPRLASGHGDAREVVRAAVNTTPGPIELQAYLREMVGRRVRAAVLEVSSHALDQGRAEAVDFAAAVFTNLTQDHLDYHGDMPGYAAAKARLFAGLAPGALAVLPADDASAAPMFAALAKGTRVATYALAPAARAEGLFVRGEILDSDLSGSRIAVETHEGIAEVELPLVGRHNVRNALAALACATGLGVGTLAAADALSRARPLAGRLERVADAGFPIYVDYAHSPDALAEVLAALAPHTRGSLRLVFGCGGERDRTKRPQMGRIAATAADQVVITQDNPRGEDPERIVSEILEGVPEASGRRASLEVCPDRRLAIRHLLDGARPGDTVLIAGKGHESGQVVGDRVLPFDDREEVEAWLCHR